MSGNHQICILRNHTCIRKSWVHTSILRRRSYSICRHGPQVFQKLSKALVDPIKATFSLFGRPKHHFRLGHGLGFRDRIGNCRLISHWMCRGRFWKSVFETSCQTSFVFVSRSHWYIRWNESRCFYKFRKVLTQSFMYLRFPMSVRSNA